MECKLDLTNGVHRLHNCNAHYIVEEHMDDDMPFVVVMLQSYHTNIMTVVLWYSESDKGGEPSVPTSFTVYVHNNPCFSSATRQHVYKFIRSLFGYYRDAYSLVRGCRYVFDNKDNLPAIYVTLFGIYATIVAKKTGVA